MLSKFLIAAAGLFLLSACQQNQAVSTPPPQPVQKNFTVLFATSQATLTPESMATIATAANSFKVSGARAVAVSGHTDTTGPAAYNLDLSKRRAAAVSAELQRNGVPAAAIAALGYGETNLPVPTAQNVAEQRNRSVDIAISERDAASLMSDTQYCKALSATYRRYRPNQIDESAAEAMARCETTEAPSAIAVLENALSQQKIPLPARTVSRS